MCGSIVTYQSKKCACSAQFRPSEQKPNHIAPSKSQRTAVAEFANPIAKPDAVDDFVYCHSPNQKGIEKRQMALEGAR
jgi:hypothetical protein